MRTEEYFVNTETDIADISSEKLSQTMLIIFCAVSRLSRCSWPN
jgi:hypothetical protein